MLDLLFDILLLPFKIILWLVEFMGRTAALLVGLALFGLGALLCMMGVLIFLGAPCSLIGVIIVIKAL